jgi:hypothetical protein
VGFVVDKAALGQVSFDFFGFSCQLHSTSFFTFIIIYHPELTQ